ncbi:hypothetical protein FJ546_03385 [Mesorhizobium sp. B2-4-19]|nr:hypothetical protein FJ546_03385 [Mesorhizobium sp. B2-4-19]
MTVGTHDHKLNELHDGADYTPYEGLEVTGWPTTVIVGGAAPYGARLVCGQQRGPESLPFRRDLAHRQ